MEKEKIIKSKKIYDGKIIKLEVNDVICPNGNISEREIIHHPGGVCILVDINGKIILEKQYRSPFDDFIYELPAGKLEKGENPKTAAIRELEEEVGLKATSMIEYGEMYPSVGYTDEIIYLYVANDVTEGKQMLDEDENLEICYLTKDEIKLMINKGKIKDAKSLVLLLKYFQQN